MKSLVTTRTGDSGMTHCIGGRKISKSDPIVECCGWLDVVRAQTALARLDLIEEGPEDYEDIADFLFWLLNAYFLVGTACSDPLREHPEYWKGAIGPEHVQRVESEQEMLEAHLTLPRAFIVSATTRMAAKIDVTATFMRTFERSLVALQEAVPEFDAAHLIPFANRLGDYFYVLARYLENHEHQPVDYGLLEK